MRLISLSQAHSKPASTSRKCTIISSYSASRRLRWRIARQAQLPTAIQPAMTAAISTAFSRPMCIPTTSVSTGERQQRLLTALPSPQ
jgi:hypothetical protein